MILLYAVAEAIDSAAWDWNSLIFLLWAFALIPLISALVGASTAWLTAKYGPNFQELSILSAIAGVVAILGGILLFFFISAFLSPPDSGLGLMDRWPYFTDPLASLLIDPMALAALALYVLIAIACGLLYGRLAQKKTKAINAQ